MTTLRGPYRHTFTNFIERGTQNVRYILKTYIPSINWIVYDEADRTGCTYILGKYRDELVMKMEIFRLDIGNEAMIYFHTHMFTGLLNCVIKILNNFQTCLRTVVQMQDPEYCGRVKKPTPMYPGTHIHVETLERTARGLEEENGRLLQRLIDLELYVSQLQERIVYIPLIPPYQQI